MPRNQTGGIPSLIDTIRGLRPESSRQEFEAAMDKLNNTIPGQGRFAERQPYGKAILKISQGLHPDAALINEGKLDIKKASPEGLSSLGAHLQKENEKNAPLADLQPENPKGSAKDIAKGIGKEAAEGFSEAMEKLPGRAVKLAGKVVKGAFKAADVGEYIKAGKIVRNTLLAAQVQDEIDRRSKEQKKPKTGDKSGTSGGEDPGFGNNGPTGQDDGADDDNPSSGPSDSSSSDSSSGAGQPQSLNVTDPEAPSQTMELKPGEEGKNQTMEIKPEQRKLMDDISKSDGPLDEILAKDPRDLTEGEFVALKKEVINLPAGPEQDRLDGMATAFLEVLSTAPTPTN